MMFEIFEVRHLLSIFFFFCSCLMNQSSRNLITGLLLLVCSLKLQDAKYYINNVIYIYI